ncbi:Hypothetical_protein [Hexamita inflata]|uniref:Hypothetical_protein n=1 Tax=Hexamita inflata TaxID=28002 RepID=A0AA86QE23_9EUKA|nr:Hypothetical protein HINF_LOCUS39052 [Hexamita inflata]
MFNIKQISLYNYSQITTQQNQKVLKQKPRLVKSNLFYGKRGFDDQHKYDSLQQQQSNSKQDTKPCHLKDQNQTKYTTEKAPVQQIDSIQQLLQIVPTNVILQDNNKFQLRSQYVEFDISKYIKLAIEESNQYISQIQIYIPEQTRIENDDICRVHKHIEIEQAYQAIIQTSKTLPQLLIHVDRIDDIRQQFSVLVYDPLEYDTKIKFNSDVLLEESRVLCSKIDQIYLEQVAANNPHANKLQIFKQCEQSLVQEISNIRVVRELLTATKLIDHQRENYEFDAIE